MTMTTPASSAKDWVAGLCSPELTAPWVCPMPESSTALDSWAGASSFTRVASRIRAVARAPPPRPTPSQSSEPRRAPTRPIPSIARALEEHDQHKVSLADILSRASELEPDPAYLRHLPQLHVSALWTEAVDRAPVTVEGHGRSCASDGTHLYVHGSTGLRKVRLRDGAVVASSDLRAGEPLRLAVAGSRLYCAAEQGLWPVLEEIHTETLAVAAHVDLLDAPASSTWDDLYGDGRYLYLLGHSPTELVDDTKQSSPTADSPRRKHSKAKAARNKKKAKPQQVAVYRYDPLAPALGGAARSPEVGAASAKAEELWLATGYHFSKHVCGVAVAACAGDLNAAAKFLLDHGEVLRGARPLALVDRVDLQGVTALDLLRKVSVVVTGVQLVAMIPPYTHPYTDDDRTLTRCYCLRTGALLSESVLGHEYIAETTSSVAYDRVSNTLWSLVQVLAHEMQVTGYANLGPALDMDDQHPEGSAEHLAGQAGMFWYAVLARGLRVERVRRTSVVLSELEYISGVTEHPEYSVEWFVTRVADLPRSALDPTEVAAPFIYDLSLDTLELLTEALRRHQADPVKRDLLLGVLALHIARVPRGTPVPGPHALLLDLALQHDVAAATTALCCNLPLFYPSPELQRGLLLSLLGTDTGLLDRVAAWFTTRFEVGQTLVPCMPELLAAMVATNAPDALHELVCAVLRDLLDAAPGPLRQFAEAVVELAAAQGLAGHRGLLQLVVVSVCVVDEPVLPDRVLALVGALDQANVALPESLAADRAFVAAVRAEDHTLAVVESSHHPYALCPLSESVAVAGAAALLVEFDPRCGTRGPADALTLAYTGRGAKTQTLGPYHSGSWPVHRVVVPAPALKLKFAVGAPGADDAPGFGFRVRVRGVVPHHLAAWALHAELALAEVLATWAAALVHSPEQQDTHPWVDLGLVRDGPQACPAPLRQFIEGGADSAALRVWRTRKTLAVRPDMEPVWARALRCVGAVLVHHCGLALDPWDAVVEDRLRFVGALAMRTEMWMRRQVQWERDWIFEGLEGGAADRPAFDEDWGHPDQRDRLVAVCQTRGVRDAPDLLDRAWALLQHEPAYAGDDPGRESYTRVCARVTRHCMALLEYACGSGAGRLDVPDTAEMKRSQSHLWDAPVAPTPTLSRAISLPEIANAPAKEGGLARRVSVLRDWVDNYRQWKTWQSPVEELRAARDAAGTPFELVEGFLQGLCTPEELHAAARASARRAADRTAGLGLLNAALARVSFDCVRLAVLGRAPDAPLLAGVPVCAPPARTALTLAAGEYLGLRVAVLTSRAHALPAKLEALVDVGRARPPLELLDQELWAAVLGVLRDHADDDDVWPEFADAAWAAVERLALQVCCEWPAGSVAAHARSALRALQAEVLAGLAGLLEAGTRVHATLEVLLQVAEAGACDLCAADFGPILEGLLDRYTEHPPQTLALVFAVLETLAWVSADWVLASISRLLTVEDEDPDDDDEELDDDRQGPYVVTGHLIPGGLSEPEWKEVVPLALEAETPSPEQEREAEARAAQAYAARQAMVVRDGPTVHLRSLAGLVRFTDAGLGFVSDDGFATVVADVAVTAGKWYYELRVTSPGIKQVGWATAALATDPAKYGVGDDPHSWAFDGDRARSWHGQGHDYGRRWAVGDVVGVLLDLDARVMRFSLNDDDLGVAFRDFLVPDGLPLSPAVSFSAGESGVLVFHGAQLTYALPDAHFALDGDHALVPGRSTGRRAAKLAKDLVNLGAAPLAYGARAHCHVLATALARAGAAVTVARAHPPPYPELVYTGAARAALVDRFVALYHGWPATSTAAATLAGLASPTDPPVVGAVCVAGGWGPSPADAPPGLLEALAALLPTTSGALRVRTVRALSQCEGSGPLLIGLASGPPADEAAWVRAQTRLADEASPFRVPDLYPRGSALSGAATESCAVPEPYTYGASQFAAGSGSSSTTPSPDTNRMLRYWEKHIIPRVQDYVRGSFKDYEMEYFFESLRQPLRAGQQDAAVKIAYTLCGGRLPEGVAVPGADRDWDALLIDEVAVGAAVLVRDHEPARVKALDLGRDLVLVQHYGQGRFRDRWVDVAALKPDPRAPEPRPPPSHDAMVALYARRAVARVCCASPRLLRHTWDASGAAALVDFVSLAAAEVMDGGAAHLPEGLAHNLAYVLAEMTHAQRTALTAAVRTKVAGLLREARALAEPRGVRVRAAAVTRLHVPGAASLALLLPGGAADLRVFADPHCRVELAQGAVHPGPELWVRGAAATDLAVVGVSGAWPLLGWLARRLAPDAVVRLLLEELGVAALALSPAKEPALELLTEALARCASGTVDLARLDPLHADLMDVLAREAGAAAHTTAAQRLLDLCVVLEQARVPPVEYPYREDDDDQEEEEQEEEQEQGWACGACTFHNSEAELACMICESPRGPAPEPSPASAPTAAPEFARRAFHDAVCWTRMAAAGGGSPALVAECAAELRVDESQVLVVDQVPEEVPGGLFPEDQCRVLLVAEDPGRRMGPVPAPVAEDLTLAFHAPLDTQGLLYRLGCSASGGGPWTNPAPEHVRVTASSLQHDSEALEAVAGRAAVRVVTEPVEGGGWVRLDLLHGVRVRPAHYSLRHYSTWDTEALRHWVLEGLAPGGQGDTWDVLRHHVDDDALDAAGVCAAWPVPMAEQYYGSLRVRMTAPNSNGNWYLALSGFEVYGDVRGLKTTPVRATNRFAVVDVVAADPRAFVAAFHGREVRSAPECPVRLSVAPVRGHPLEPLVREALMGAQWKALVASGTDLRLHASTAPAAVLDQYAAVWAGASPAQHRRFLEWVEAACARWAVADPLALPAHRLAAPADVRAEPLFFGHAAALTTPAVRLRLLVLQRLNRVARRVLPLVTLAGAGRLAAQVRAARPLLFRAVRTAHLHRLLEHSAADRSRPPAVALDRLALRLAGRSVFEAVRAALRDTPAGQLRPRRPLGADPFLAFEVVLRGEHVVGEAGPYRQVFSDIAAELPGLGLVLPCPNAQARRGDHQDRAVLRPGADPARLEFLGVLFGCCVRTGVRLPLDLAPFVWKAVAGAPLTAADLRAVDLRTAQVLEDLARPDLDPAAFDAAFDERFEITLSDRSLVELKEAGSRTRVRFADRDEYVRLALRARLRESAAGVAALRRGLDRVVPVALVDLVSWRELEVLVCGRRATDLALLRRHTIYAGVDEAAAHVQYLWQVLEEFPEALRRQFIRFAWAQERLPADDEEFRRTHTRFMVKGVHKLDPDARFPKADTCFFNLELPAYSSKAVLRDRLVFAITHTTSMDADQGAGDMHGSASDLRQGPQQGNRFASIFQ